MLEFRREVAADVFQVGGAGLFHLDLDGAVLRIHVVEDLFAALAGVGLHVVIEELVDVLQRAFLRNLQTKVVHTGELIVDVHPADRLDQGTAAVEEQRAEVEVVAQGAELAVDHGRVGPHVTALVEMVGIDHRSPGVLHQVFHTLQGEKDDAECRVLGGNQGIRRLGVLGDGLHGSRAVEPRNLQYFASERLGGRLGSDMEEENLIDQILRLEIGHRLGHLRFVLERNETVDVLHR